MGTQLGLELMALIQSLFPVCGPRIPFSAKSKGIRGLKEIENMHPNPQGLKFWTEDELHMSETVRHKSLLVCMESPGRVR